MSTPLRSNARAGSIEQPKLRRRATNSVSEVAPPAARTALGKRLWQLRRRIIASGATLLDWDGVEREVRKRRGERGLEAQD